MRRLFWLVAAVVLVDTMFFAAVAPLLPQYADDFGLSKTGSRGAFRGLSRRARSPVRCPPAGWPRAGA